MKQSRVNPAPNSIVPTPLPQTSTPLTPALETVVVFPLVEVVLVDDAVFVTEAPFPAVVEFIDPIMFDEAEACAAAAVEVLDAMPPFPFPYQSNYYSTQQLPLLHSQ